MTADGIATEDWDEIRDLAANVANASIEEDEQLGRAHVSQLMSALDRLESHYGRKPSITATRADYVERIDEALSLLVSAFELAEEQRDLANMAYIASSLAERYVEELHDVEQGRIWADRLRQTLALHPDDDEAETLRELELRLADLESAKRDPGGLGRNDL